MWCHFVTCMLVRGLLDKTGMKRITDGEFFQSCILCREKRLDGKEFPISHRDYRLAGRDVQGYSFWLCLSLVGSGWGRGVRNIYCMKWNSEKEQSDGFNVHVHCFSWDCIFLPSSPICWTCRDAGTPPMNKNCISYVAAEWMLGHRCQCETHVYFCFWLSFLFVYCFLACTVAQMNLA